MSDQDEIDDGELAGVYPLGAYAPDRADRDAPALLVGVDREAPGDVAAGATAFRASSAREDRHLSVIDQSSWDLRNYRRNPVVLLNHARGGLPIGRATVAKVVDRHKEGAYLRIDVLPDVESPQGALVAGQLARGFLSAGSVGFRPGKSTDRSKLAPDHPAYRAAQDGDSPWWPALFYERSELLEFSIVTVPSNVDAQALRSWASEREDPREAVRRYVDEVLDRVLADRVREALGAPGVLTRIQSLIFGGGKPPPANNNDDSAFARWWEG